MESVTIDIDKAISNCYALLLNQNPAKDFEIGQRIQQHMSAFAQKCSPSGGYYFFGDWFSVVDVLFAPFVDRFIHTLSHYRGYKLIEQVSDPALRHRLNLWWRTVSSRPALQKTSAGRSVYLRAYSAYANGMRAAGRGVSDTFSAPTAGQAMSTSLPSSL
mmetsp:Transcript_9986/g.19014  ORF Transcript_9986/g.19014 Transcript_9986/m.19014 type:complete len:160 (+) Transcript_9986:59-538(+)